MYFSAACHCVVACILMVWALGCEDIGQRDGAIVQDSAGITIIDNRPSDREVAQLHIAPQPVMRIGSRDEDSEEALFRVRGAFRTAAGQMVIANGGTNQIMVFSADGELERTFGATGGGPGEFRWLTGLWGSGDTIFAYDNALMRVSRFRLDSGFVGSVRLETPSELGRPSARASFSGGDLLALNAPVGRVGGEIGILPGAEWNLSRYGPDGEYINTIATAQESPRWGHEIPGLPPGIYLPFTLGLFPYTAYGQRVYIGPTPEEAEIEVYDLTGSLDAIIRWEKDARRIGDQDRQAYRTQMRNEGVKNGFDKQAWNRYLREVTFPEKMPIYERLRAGGRGNLWVEQYSVPWDSGPTSWLVFSPEGILTARARLPPRFELLTVGRDMVVGVRTDRLDVEYVEVLRFR